MTAHWGIEDPAAIEGPEQREAFATALRHLQNRITLFLSLPIDSIERPTLQKRLREIGTTTDAPVVA